MFSRIVFFIFLLQISHSSFAIVEKIAVVDVQTILDQSTAVVGIRKAAEKINQDLQAEFTYKENELKAIESKLLEARNTLSQEKFEHEVAEFNKKVTDVQKIIQDKKIRLEQAHARAISNVNEVALRIISDLAFEGKYTLILPSTQVLYANEKLNITDDVLTRLNTKIPTEKLKF